MTLRVEVSIIPFGEESGKRIIHQINISNLGPSEFGDYKYGVEVDKYKTGEYDCEVFHRRSLGALVLVDAVFAKLSRQGKLDESP